MLRDADEDQKADSDEKIDPLHVQLLGFLAELMLRPGNSITWSKENQASLFSMF